MKKTARTLWACGIVGGLFASTAICASSLAGAAVDVSVTVSPSNIVLGADKGSSVTVHTDIPLSIVERNSVALSGVSPYLTKADSRGNLVAKFRQEAIEAIVAPPSATLVLTGMTKDGTPFSGSDTVRVIEDPAS